jgi:hypothetical protein
VAGQKDDVTVRARMPDPPRRGRDADARDLRDLAIIAESHARRLAELEHPDDASRARGWAGELRRIANRLEAPPDTSGVPDE